MICYWSVHCMLRPSLWFVTGQNTVCYDQVYDLLLVKTLYVTTKFMICYWSENTTWSLHSVFWPVKIINFVVTYSVLTSNKS
jgi:hypothetical protein